MSADDDVLELVARYAPTTATLTRGWAGTRPENAIEQIVAAEPDVPVRLVAPRTRPGRRRALVPLFASAAALALGAAALIGVLMPDDGSGSRDAGGAHGAVFDPPSGLSASALPPGTFSYRVVEQLGVDKAGLRVPNYRDALVDRAYVSAAGDIVSFRSGTQHGCFVLTNSSPDFSQASVRFFASLPTGVAALQRYLGAHTQGSSSRDEAVFVAVGDMLRTADGLASPRLRGALVAVLSRTPGVFLHRGQHDYLGRPALRLDFVNQRIRPGEISSLYFDPTRFRLLAERQGRNDQPATFNGPSPAYTAPAPSTADDPATLSGPAYVSVARSETVVKRLPPVPSNCQH